jgi:hypothetical protein
MGESSASFTADTSLGRFVGHAQRLVRPVLVGVVLGVLEAAVTVVSGGSALPAFVLCLSVCTSTAALLWAVGSAFGRWLGPRAPARVVRSPAVRVGLLLVAGLCWGASPRLASGVRPALALVTCAAAVTGAALLVRRPSAQARMRTATLLLLATLCSMVVLPIAVRHVVHVRPALARTIAAETTISGAALAVVLGRGRGVEHGRDVGEQAVAMAPRRLDLRGRDVLLITVDALRADCLRAYGGTGTTPRLDALAEEGVVFERAYTPTPHTSYAVASLLTGRFVRDVLAAGQSLGPPAFPHVLAAAGYRTAAFFPPAVFYVDAHRLRGLREGNLGFTQGSQRQASGRERVDELAGYLRSVPREQRVFAWVHLFEPHEPYEPIAGRPNASQRERYDAEVTAADAAVGELVATFRRARGDVAVIVTADHGEEFGEHGGIHHGTTLYDEQARVPLVWWAPGAVPRGRVRAPVETVDVATTLLPALGLSVPSSMDGDDLGSAFHGAEVGPRWATAAVGEQRMITDGRHKAICEQGALACDVFDLRADPAERSPLDAAAAIQGRLVISLAQSLRAVAMRMMPGASPVDMALARASLFEPGIAPELLPLLRDREAVVRARSALMMADYSFDSSADELRRMAADPDPTVRAAVAASLLTLTGEGDRTELAAWCGDPAVQSFVQRRVARALAEQGEGQCIDVLAAWAADGEAPLSERKRALRAVGTGAATVELIRRLTDLHRDPVLRVEATEALGALGTDAARRVLAAALEVEPYPLARRAEARALAPLDERTAARLLRRHLGAPEAVPDGVALLLSWGHLAQFAPDGVDLRVVERAREGEWSCDPEGCRAGPGAAAVTLPVSGRLQGPVVVTIRVVGARDGVRVRFGEHEVALREGPEEWSFRESATAGASRRWEITPSVDARWVALVVSPENE